MHLTLFRYRQSHSSLPGGNNALLILCDQLEAQDSAKHGTTYLSD
jgi:hypothetical protein